MAERICEVPDCDKPSARTRFCGMHRYRLKHFGSFNPPPPRQWKTSKCRGEGCETAVDPARCASGLCKSCYRRKWYADHQEHESLGNRPASANRRAAGWQPLTFRQYRMILDDHGMRCHICGTDIGSVRDLHFDHVVPLSAGGEHLPRNIRPAHAICNMRKGNRLTA